MNKNIRIERFDFVDLLKAIATLFVLVYHLSIMDVDFLHHKEWSVYMGYYLKSLLSTCVPLFFFVNGGLLMRKSKLEVKGHARKIIKIILLTLVWGVITQIALSLIWSVPLSFFEIIQGVFILKRGWVNHLWFFEALIVIYVFYPLLFNSLKTNVRVFYYFASAVFVFTFLNRFIGDFTKMLSMTFGFLGDGDFESINYFLDFNPFKGIYGYSIGYFILGGILFNFQTKLKTNKARLLSIILLPISMGLLFLYGVKISEDHNEIWDIVWYGYDNIFTLINVVLLFLLALHYKKRGLFGRLVALIAENSLGIYLIHLIIRALIKPYIPMSGFLGTLIFALSSLFISLSISLVIKKIPVLRFLLSFK